MHKVLAVLALLAATLVGGAATAAPTAPGRATGCGDPPSHLILDLVVHGMTCEEGLRLANEAVARGIPLPHYRCSRYPYGNRLWITSCTHLHPEVAGHHGFSILTTHLR